MRWKRTGLEELWASLVAQLARNTPAMRETWVRSLGWEDALKEGMVTHSSVPAWRIPWTEEFGGLQPTGSQRIGLDWVTKHTATPQKRHSSILLTERHSRHLSVIQTVYLLIICPAPKRLRWLLKKRMQYKSTKWWEDIRWEKRVRK